MQVGIAERSVRPNAPRTMLTRLPRNLLRVSVSNALIAFEILRFDLFMATIDAC